MLHLPSWLKTASRKQRDDIDETVKLALKDTRNDFARELEKLRDAMYQQLEEKRNDAAN